MSSTRRPSRERLGGRRADRSQTSSGVVGPYFGHLPTVFLHFSYAFLHLRVFSCISILFLLCPTSSCLLKPSLTFSNLLQPSPKSNNNVVTSSKK